MGNSLFAHRDLRPAAWSRRAYDTRDGDPQSVRQKLLRGLLRGDILLLHDGNAADVSEMRAKIQSVSIL